MHFDSLELLCCPLCKGKLSCRGEAETGVVRKGDLWCGGCNQNYPIEKGIPRFIIHSRLFGLNRGFEKAYNRISYIYDSAFTRVYLLRYFWPSSGEEKARREVIERLETWDDSIVLETGIGTGDNIPYLSEYAHRVRLFGLDISVGMLRQCVKNLKRWEREAELFLGNAEELPFKDESFDVVFHVGGINFFTEKKRAIEEMIRVARPGTKIVIACETEKAIQSNRVGIRLAFGRELAARMLEFRSHDMLQLVPENIFDIKCDNIWEGNGYLLEFRKPSQNENVKIVKMRDALK